jgi:uncharacterized protein (DUF305 family)
MLIHSSWHHWTWSIILILQILPSSKRVCSGLLVITATLVSLGQTIQAAPLSTESPPPIKPPSGLPAAQGWGGMPMGWRDADAHFIVMMIPHHEGAIAMADLALKRSRRQEIRALANRIRTSQSHENAQMRSWYRQW